MKTILSYLLLLSFTASPPAFAETPPKPTKELHLITGESPPYMSESMKDQGAAVWALRKIFAKMGYTLVIDFAPWTRAKITAAKSDTIDGFFPYSDQDVPNFIYSDIVSETPWVIIQRKDKPIHWSKFSDLSPYTAGNVVGIELRPGIKELYEAKKLNIETTTSDVSNLLKLANKRVDMIFMDATVFQYSMAKEKELQPYRGKLEINAKPILVNKYGIALKNTPRNAAIMKEFNRHVNPQEFAKDVESYLTHGNQHP
ncbi:ABC transporter substrate-binding protein [Bdellovibrio sp. NC01]|uniref:substrate-binding periplasmic protein n=1 Tax=Bdellovibrio sp. NC01 TaxID=2220073 RepID=UPI00115A573E|nr:ABC transporter substrate-binding protein [Bdellovibrio sp. NC01]QDK38193.1 amino acid ABC transporter substrate-binding protein [Bdellovibrio sp. NC01]